MRNRDWFLKHCLYDIFVLMQEQRGDCIIEDLTNTIPKTCIRLSDSPFESCKECIQEWLNQEHKK